MPSRDWQTEIGRLLWVGIPGPTLDDASRGYLDAYLTALFNERNFDRSDYFRLLTRTMVALWQHGPDMLAITAALYLLVRNRRRPGTAGWSGFWQ